MVCQCMYIGCTAFSNDRQDNIYTPTQWDDWDFFIFNFMFGDRISRGRKNHVGSDDKLIILYCIITLIAMFVIALT